MIPLRDGDPRVVARLAGIAVNPCISALTLIELEGGVHAKPDLSAKRRQRLDLILAEFTLIEVDADVASRYGAIVAECGFSRRKIIDRVIAATALVHDLTLITLNVGDFQDIPGLRVESWQDASPE